MPLSPTHPLVDGRTTNSSLVRAYRGDRPERTPVWFMRQAGRSLPEYRELRAGGDMLLSERCSSRRAAAFFASAGMPSARAVFAKIITEAAKMKRPCEIRTSCDGFFHDHDIGRNRIG